MGEQQWMETAVELRSGFEDALEVIRAWQRKKLEPHQIHTDQVPPPFIHEGYWANYADAEKTFPEDWKKFNETEKLFFHRLWEMRAYSVFRTWGWFLRQQIRLFFLPGIKLPARLVYLPLQFLFPIAEVLALLTSPRIITRILADVRLYAHPQGMTEKAIVQQIDYRVGQEFLRILGLDWDFHPLPKKQQLGGPGKPIKFNRILWVAHSLGTVISYNVLSDLFQRAAELEKSGSKAQRAGVKKFRTSLRRFVTLGSPLDKFAALFPDTLRPWPTHDRTNLLADTGDTYTDSINDQTLYPHVEAKEWWINFYHVLDPVSGALDNPNICGENPPLNFHSDWKSLALVPGLAHSSYWSALKVLRFFLGRTYGKEYLQDEKVKKPSSRKQTWFAILGYFMWVLLLYGIIFLLIWFHRDILQWCCDILKSSAQISAGT